MKNQELLQGGDLLTKNGNGHRENALSEVERQNLVVEAMHLVPKMSWKFLHSGIEVDDLNQIGYLALVEGSVRYDGCLGVSFSDYSYLRVKGAMVDYLRGNDSLTRGDRKALKIFINAKHTLSCQLQRTPTNQEVGELLGLDTAFVKRIEEAEYRSHVHSLDETTSAGLGNDSSLTLGDTVTDQNSESQDEIISRLMAEDALRSISKYLLFAGNQKRTVFQGIMKELQGRQIASQLGISESRVSQIRAELESDLAVLLNRDGSSLD